MKYLHKNDFFAQRKIVLLFYSSNIAAAHTFYLNDGIIKLKLRFRQYFVVKRVICSADCSAIFLFKNNSTSSPGRLG